MKFDQIYTVSHLPIQWRRSSNINIFVLNAIHTLQRREVFPFRDHHYLYFYIQGYVFCDLNLVGLTTKNCCLEPLIWDLIEIAKMQKYKKCVNNGSERKLYSIICSRQNSKTQKMSDIIYGRSLVCSTLLVAHLPL